MRVARSSAHTRVHRSHRRVDANPPRWLYACGMDHSLYRAAAILMTIAGLLMLVSGELLTSGAMLIAATLADLHYRTLRDNPQLRS